MGERTFRAEDMATTSTAVTTVPPAPQVQEEGVTVITLRPNRPPRSDTRKKVVWTEDTVDNEDMNKKKSKCCCIYEKPHKFGESDSEDSDDECEHCFGHVERRRQGGATVQETVVVENVVTTNLKQPESTKPDPPDKDTVDSAT